MSATHNSTAPKTSDNISHSSNTLGGNKDEYPEQIHAGAVGFGPNYHAGPTLTDKVQGLKEELKGKLTNNPDLVQHGRDVKSGEERRKKLTGEDEPNPFSSADKVASSDTTPSSGSDSSNVPPRHQGHPMQPAARTEPSKQHHLSESSDFSDRHQASAPTDTDTDTDTDTTHLPGLNSPFGPFGLRDGNITTIVGTPDLAPTTASQQPAFQASQDTSSDQTRAEATGLDSVPHAPARDTAPTSLPFLTPGSIKEQQDQQMTRPAHLSSSSSSGVDASSTSTRDFSSESQSQSQVDSATALDLTPQTLANPLDSPFLKLGESSPSSGGRPGDSGVSAGHADWNGNKAQPTYFEGNEKAPAHQPFQTDTFGQAHGMDQTTQSERKENEFQTGDTSVKFDVDDTPAGREAARAAAVPQPPRQ